MSEIQVSPALIAYDAVNSGRAPIYGHPLDNFTRTADLWTAYMSRPGLVFQPEDVAMFMVLLKVAREANLHLLDNLVDICGYAETCQMVIVERDRREERLARPFGGNDACTD